MTVWFTNSLFTFIIHLYCALILLQCKAVRNEEALLEETVLCICLEKILTS